MNMKVLVACEFSGIVRDAFIEAGHESISCDLLPTERPGPHIQDNVLLHLNKGWDMMIAHPPCTRLCNSGVRWLHERDLWAEMEKSAKFFKTLLEASIPRIAIENPVMHRYAMEIIGHRPNFSIQPWQLGAPFKKRTCFWTKNLPPLKPLRGASDCDAVAYSYNAPPHPDRWKNRSRTYPGVAKEMANQWGKVFHPVQMELYMSCNESKSIQA